MHPKWVQVLDKIFNAIKKKKNCCRLSYIPQLLNILYSTWTSLPANAYFSLGVGGGGGGSHNFQQSKYNLESANPQVESMSSLQSANISCLSFKMLNSLSVKSHMAGICHSVKTFDYDTIINHFRYLYHLLTQARHVNPHHPHYLLLLLVQFKTPNGPHKTSILIILIIISYYCWHCSRHPLTQARHVNHHHPHHLLLLLVLFKTSTDPWRMYHWWMWHHPTSSVSCSSRGSRACRCRPETRSWRWSHNQGVLGSSPDRSSDSGQTPSPPHLWHTQGGLVHPAPSISPPPSLSLSYTHIPPSLSYTTIPPPTPLSLSLSLIHTSLPSLSLYLSCKHTLPSTPLSLPLSCSLSPPKRQWV